MKKGLLIACAACLILGCGCVHRAACPDMPDKSIGYYKGLKIRADLMQASDYNKQYKLRVYDLDSGMPLEEHMQMYTDKGMSRKEAMKQVAADRGVSKRDIYQALLED